MRASLLPTPVTIALFACVAVFASTTADAQPKKKGNVEAGPEFDRIAAATAINEVDLSKCKATNAAKGDGHVTITFAPAGDASDVKIDKGPWIGTPVAKCMTKAFKKAKVPAFKGDAVTVGKTFKFGE
ncbi:MAG: hypothetical protein KIT84_04430 [Labilithrix sp.]|nr:hypothetical protein [Labilithrix sp.]MCW5810233.1 hypothetical protein [Labilithrix sp.]